MKDDRVIGNSGWSHIGAWVLLYGSGSLGGEGKRAKIYREISICISCTHISHAILHIQTGEVCWSRSSE